jgi:hypothetical protein
LAGRYAGRFRLNSLDKFDLHCGIIELALLRLEIHAAKLGEFRRAALFEANAYHAAGGSSLFMSTKERLDRELLDLAPGVAKVKVSTHQNVTERKYSVWLGGSILGCLGSFHELWMSKQEYQEHGASLIHRKSP